MAWTGQTFAVGQILTAAQMTNLQNDITALANGDSGAPGIKNEAINFTATAGSQIAAISDLTVSTFSTSYVQKKEIVVPYGGVFTINYDLITSNAGSAANADIRRNGTSQNIQTTVSTSFVPKTYNITVSKGDLIQLFIKSTTGASMSAKSFRVLENKNDVSFIVILDDL